MGKSRTLKYGYRPLSVFFTSLHHKHPMVEVKCERVNRTMPYSRLRLGYSLWLKKFMAISQDSCKAIMNKQASHWFDWAELEWGGFPRLNARWLQPGHETLAVLGYPWHKTIQGFEIRHI